MDDREKLRRIAELIEDYKDVEADYETVKHDMANESFYEVASGITDLLSTIKKIAEVLSEVY
jgi:DNA-binding transcriptional regulator GbsR (MarR family)